MNLAEINRLLANLIRGGVIASYNPDTYKVTVKTGDILTQELDFCLPAAGNVFHHYAPTVGEPCVLLSPSGNLAAAWVLVGVSSENNLPTNPSETIHHIAYKDGATISYDFANGQLVADGIKGAKITASKKIELTAPIITLTASNKITFDTPQATATKNLTSEGLLSTTGGFSAVNTTGIASNSTAVIDMPVKFTKTVTSIYVIKDGHIHDLSIGGTTSEPR